MCQAIADDTVDFDSAASGPEGVGAAQLAVGRTGPDAVTAGVALAAEDAVASASNAVC